MHFHLPPVKSTRQLVTSAPLTKLDTGTRVAVELIAYPDGQLRLVTSSIEGPDSNRTIKQNKSLMFRDSNEIKDALDLLVDFVQDAATCS